MGEGAWADDNPYWGLWGIPESDTDLLPEEMSGDHVAHRMPTLLDAYATYRLTDQGYANV